MAQISAALEAEHSTWEGAGEVGVLRQTPPSLFVAVDAIKAHRHAEATATRIAGIRSNRAAGTQRFSRRASPVYLIERNTHERQDHR